MAGSNKDSFIHDFHTNPFLFRLAKDWPKRIRPQFESAKNLWNSRIREFYRNSMALRLQRVHEGRTIASNQIQIRFTSDYNNRLISLLNHEYNEYDPLKNIRLKKLIQSINESLQYFEEPEHSNLTTSRLRAESMVKDDEEETILQSWFSTNLPINEDVFGFYSLEDNHIEVHYVPIVFFATLKQLDLHALIGVVLAHELAHAYHHIALDIDGYAWKRFRYADKYIAESLAQYYTEFFVLSQDGQEQGIASAYQTLLKCQAGPYVAHKDWKRNFTPEIIRATLIETRRTGIVDFQELSGLLEDFSARLRNKESIDLFRPQR